MFYPHTPFQKYPLIGTLIRTQHDVKQMDVLYEWLCQAPKTTTIRINLLKTTTNEMIHNIKTTLKPKCSTYIPPDIILLADIPNVLLINNLCNNIHTRIENLKEVIVDIHCAAAILRGAHIYAPGVLAMPSGTKYDDVVNIYADLEGLCKKGTNIIYESLKKTFIGIGVVKMQRYQLYGPNVCRSGIAVEVTATRFGVPSLGDTYFPNTHGMLQNLPSIVCGHVLNPMSGETILDMCASPGNKTTHLAELMSDTGFIIALDKTANKVKVLQDKINNFNLKSVQCFVFDSTKSLDGNNCDVLQGPPYAAGLFDRILLDAPCSALGNRPQLQNNISSNMLASYPVIQKKLFKAAIGLLKVEGTLVYSTCTIVENENEHLVKWALDKFHNIELTVAEPLIGGPGWSGAGLSDEQRILVQRFGPELDPIRIPCELYRDTVGFFIAKFIKKAL